MFKVTSRSKKFDDIHWEGPFLDEIPEYIPILLISADNRKFSEFRIQARATRLGEFSPFEQLQTLGNFREITQLLAYSFHQNVMHKI
jgi:hypothetical protein